MFFFSFCFHFPPKGYTLVWAPGASIQKKIKESLNLKRNKKRNLGISLFYFYIFKIPYSNFLNCLPSAIVKRWTLNHGCRIFYTTFEMSTWTRFSDYSNLVELSKKTYKIIRHFARRVRWL